MSSEWDRSDNMLSISTPLLFKINQKRRKYIILDRRRRLALTCIIFLVILLSTIYCTPLHFSPSTSTTPTIRNMNQSQSGSDKNNAPNGKGRTIVIISRSSSSSSSSEDHSLRPTQHPTPSPSAPLTFRYDIDIEVSIHDESYSPNEDKLHLSIDSMLHQLPLNDDFMITVQIMDQDENENIVRIRIDIYSPNDYDRGMIMAYLSTDGFSNHLSASLNEPAQAVTIEHVGFYDNGSDTSFHSLFIVVIIIMAILFCIVLLSGAYYLHRKQKQKMSEYGLTKTVFSSSSHNAKDAQSEEVKYGSLHHQNEEVDEEQQQIFAVSESIELFSSDKDEEESEEEEYEKTFVVRASMNSLPPFQKSDPCTEATEGSLPQTQNSVLPTTDCEESKYENDGNDDDDIAQPAATTDSAFGNKLFRQISNLLIANGVNLDEFKQSMEVVQEEEEEEDEDEEVVEEGLNDGDNETSVDVDADEKKKKEQMEWNSKAMAILKAHKQKQLNQAQIEKARKLLELKRKMRGRVRKSVLNRRDLLKLNKQKLAKKCNQANLPSNGTKQEMVDRLIENNKKKANKHKKSEHVIFE